MMNFELFRQQLQEEELLIKILKDEFQYTKDSYVRYIEPDGYIVFRIYPDDNGILLNTLETLYLSYEEKVEFIKQRLKLLFGVEF